ncbi:uncharacterized protein LOC123876677 isoform X1 [Maniola jurtina]|uniref:uncharacterized protein LOC123876677 isoform X1 n=1 Tax=Maniola jurtina TaxID=191418 RepID=UPI001E68687B|nr:uncharacterized protein LOC123876677 isoform X1 [Maniola jurtina]
MEPINLIGIGNLTSHCTNELCSFQLKSLHSDYVAELTCPVLPELTGDIPRLLINTNNLKFPTDVQLADPNFYKPSPIDVLVGADLFWHIVGCERQTLGANKPYLINSEFGWILSGPINSGTHPSNIRCNFQVSSPQSENLDKLLNRFWELEEFSPKKLLSEDEKSCEEHFQAHTTRDSSGRFCVRLPLKDTPDCLGNSYITARKRFFNLEKRFKAQPELKAQYTEFINEYIKLGHCSILNVTRLEPSYFLCHHAVFKQQSESTKLRVVFDASCPTSSGFSVNDLQYVGPTIQDTLFSILLRFRQHRYVLTGDIEKMFRQVTVHENDRNLQLILWRDNEHSPLQTLRLNTITYGFASASYLSTKCLWRLGEECEDDLIKTIIQRDFYMDDLLTGADTISDLHHILATVVSVLRSGCFPLRKFKSNVPSILESSAIDPLENLTLSESTSTLGLQWKPSTDTLNVIVSIPEYTDDYITKRSILSHSFKIFDPLGLISPCTIRSKILMQELWRRNIDWDEPVPCDLQETWDDLKQDLSKLEFIEIPRLALCYLPVTLELHSFCDASASAHGCCLYLRSVDHDGQVVVRLLCAKSKVNPSKPTTIPRLELLGALLAARLCKAALESLRCTISRCVHWSDSSVVLGWLRTSPSKLKTFVANRVVEICETTTPANWRHVPTNYNPADLISRGTKAGCLLDSQLWWSGPNFLSESESEWPVLGEQIEDELPEIKIHSIQVSENLISFERFSNLMRLKRAFAYTLRFIHNIKNPKDKRTGPLTVEELSQSFIFICKFAQLQSFPNEYQALINKRNISARSNLISLSPFLDEQDVMRVGGRLEHSNYDFDKKHPILLHSKHQLSCLIFRYEHVRQMHAGPQLLLYTVRNYVWPLGGRQLARRTVRNCVQCRRFQGKTITPLMGHLPAQRTTPAFPFETTGVDFAGPFTILNRKGRGSKTFKCYLCLFICFRYKCVHLEAVTELSKEAYILTLRRFIGRRGRPLEIYSDNGRNFVATATELSNFLRDAPNLVSDFSATEQIKFHFIPAYAPNFGGYWEAGIKSAKHHLKRVIGSSNLTYEELSTLLAQVEAILNSRPLCPISSSPHDLQSLTPGHFLIGRPLTSLPDPTLETEKTSNLQRYERVEQARQHFWRRWQNEYICELQQRLKWRTSKGGILQVGDLVLLQDETCPPLQWRLGRVKRLFPGVDGVARVAEIATQRGDVRRALTKLCPLLPEADADVQ